jgi:alkylhydroperoxidase/carboxymuconolactone decarboxylase family protein YurZ
MLKWFEKIQAEMEQINPKTQDLIKKFNPVGKKETVVGTLDDDLKKLLLLSVKYCVSCREAMKPMEMGGLKDFMTKVRQNQEISETLRTMFWLAVNDAFSDKATDKNLGLREGWTIVELENDKNCSTEGSTLDEILEGIFGPSIIVMSDISDFSGMFGGRRPH